MYVLIVDQNWFSPLGIFTFTHPDYNDMTFISFVTLVFGREWFNNYIALCISVSFSAFTFSLARLDSSGVC